MHGVSIVTDDDPAFESLHLQISYKTKNVEVTSRSAPDRGHEPVDRTRGSGLRALPKGFCADPMPITHRIDQFWWRRLDVTPKPIQVGPGQGTTPTTL